MQECINYRFSDKHDAFYFQPTSSLLPSNILRRLATTQIRRRQVEIQRPSLPLSVALHEFSSCITTFRWNFSNIHPRIRIQSIEEFHHCVTAGGDRGGLLAVFARSEPDPGYPLGVSIRSSRSTISLAPPPHAYACPPSSSSSSSGTYSVSYNTEKLPPSVAGRRRYVFLPINGGGGSLKFWRQEWTVKDRSKEKRVSAATRSDRRARKMYQLSGKRCDTD